MVTDPSLLIGFELRARFGSMKQALRPILRNAFLPQGLTSIANGEGLFSPITPVPIRAVPITAVEVPGQPLIRFVLLSPDSIRPA